MKHIIFSDLKKYIRLGLDDRIYQIINNYNMVSLLSKNDLIHLMKYMNKINKHSVCILEHIYLKSIYRYDFKIQLDNTLLMQKCQFGHFEVLKFLLSDQIRANYPNIDPSANNNYAIKIASQNGHFEVVQFLLSDRIRSLFPSINPTADFNYAIGVASQYGHLDVVQLLLSDKIRSLFPSIDPSALNNYAIEVASDSGHFDVVKLLLQDHRVINCGLKNAIKSARSYKRHDILVLLLSIHKN